MLDASFDGTGGVITLDGFDANIKLTIDQNGGDYEFVLSSSSGPPIAHVWNGSDIGSDVVGNGSDTLVVDRDFAIDVIVTGGTNTPDIEFERSDFVQGSGSDDIALSSVGNVTQTGELEVDILTINGATQISLSDQDNDFDSVV